MEIQLNSGDCCGKYKRYFKRRICYGTFYNTAVEKIRLNSLNTKNQNLRMFKGFVEKYESCLSPTSIKRPEWTGKVRRENRAGSNGIDIEVSRHHNGIGIKLSKYRSID